MQMVTYMKEPGSQIRLRDMEYISTLEALSTKVLGRMICNMDLELKYGQIRPGMKEIIPMERNMDKEYSNGLMVQVIKDYFKIIK